MLREIAWQFLLPPNGLVTVAALAAAWVAFGGRRPRGAAAVALVSLITLALLLTPPVTGRLVDLLEERAGLPLDVARLQGMLADGSGAPEAIVVLGGGIREDAREPDGRFSPMPRTLERLHHAARLARASSLPVLVSGGRPVGMSISEAEVMATVLAGDLGVVARWREDRSPNTDANARRSAELLNAEGISRIVLVTHAYHMWRARAVFEANGLSVVAAPTAYLTGRGASSGWLRTGVFDERAWLACHEFIGWVWYRLTGSI